MTRKILITGATGFIGGEVLARLLKTFQPEEVIVLARRKADPGSSLLALRLKEHELDPFEILPRLQWQLTDFRNPETFRADLKTLPDVSSVIHLAAVISHAEDPKDFERMNLGVTQDLINWANTKSGNFVFMSSVVSWGGARSNRIRSERDFSVLASDISLDFSYYSSKRAAHEWTVANSRIPTWILCPGIVHGSLENFKASRGHLKALREGRLHWAPRGGGSFVGLDRVAESVVRAATGETPFKAFDVQTRLLVDEHASFLDYFKLYVRLARDESSSKVITAIPAFASVLIGMIRKVVRLFGREVSMLESMGQSSLYLYFRSEFEQVPSKGLEESLKDSLRDSARSP